VSGQETDAPVSQSNQLTHCLPGSLAVCLHHARNRHFGFCIHHNDRVAASLHPEQAFVVQGTEHQRGVKAMMAFPLLQVAGRGTPVGEMEQQASPQMPGALFRRCVQHAHLIHRIGRQRARNKPCVDERDKMLLHGRFDHIGGDHSAASRPFHHPTLCQKGQSAFGGLIADAVVSGNGAGGPQRGARAQMPSADRRLYLLHDLHVERCAQMWVQV
jgi:hypothetical protein